MARHALLLGALPILLFAAGCGDCPEGETQHPVSGECVPKVDPNDNTNRPDAGPRDSGTRDAAEDGGVRDGGNPGTDGGNPGTDGGNPGLDGGLGRDAGNFGSDGGSPGFDTGVIDINPVMGGTGEGEIWIGVTREWLNGAATTSVRAQAVLQDTHNATFGVGAASYMDFDGATCTLDVKRLSSGTLTALLADRVQVVAGPGAGASFDLLPQANGRFLPAATPPSTIFDGASNSTAQIVAISGDPNSLDSLSFAAQAPQAIVISAPVLSDIMELGDDLEFAWTPSAGANNHLLLEVADQNRQVLVRCPVVDDGAYVFPGYLGTAFMAALATFPATLELRSEENTPHSGTVGGAGTVPINFRVSLGSRFAARRGF